MSRLLTAWYAKKRRQRRCGWWRCPKRALHVLYVQPGQGIMSERLGSRCWEHTLRYRVIERKRYAALELKPQTGKAEQTR